MAALLREVFWTREVGSPATKQVGNNTAVVKMTVRKRMTQGIRFLASKFKWARVGFNQEEIRDPGSDLSLTRCLSIRPEWGSFKAPPLRSWTTWAPPLKPEVLALSDLLESLRVSSSSEQIEMGCHYLMSYKAVPDGKFQDGI
jgi:hypothetical protein